MYCPNCGEKLNKNSNICPNCGNKILINDINKTSVLPQKNRYKYKKHFLFGIISTLLLIIGVILFNNFYGFNKLSWNEEYSDFKLEYISPTNIKLGINFNNDKKLKDIKYNTSCGEIKTNGLEIDWNLNDSKGTCKITVSYKLRKISKEFKIINYNINEQELTLDYEIDYNSDEDLDLDGLTNKEEKEYNTNPLLSDTDLDGLDDNYEISTIKTDPTKKDTDLDGLDDYNEIELGFDPLNADSKSDGIKDGQRNLTYNYVSDNLKLTINGTGNIASLIADIKSNTKISNKLGLIDNLYTFYTDGKIDEATLTISYTDEELINQNLNEDNLSIYYYNEKESKYEKIETIIDKQNNTLTATLKHFSNYVIGDTSLVKETTTTEILFVLDNSWSMYTNEQYKEITGKDYSGGIYSSILDGFDKEGLRFTLTSDLITRLYNKNYKIGLSEFRYDYANALKIGSDQKSLKAKLNDMNGSFVTKTEGTNIGNALTKSINEFSKDSDNKYIVILTDGQDSSLKYKTSKIVTSAIDNNIKICSIGFGGGSNNIELSNISNGTGCKFYSSANSEGLVELFDNIGIELDDDLVDIDGDSEVDGILVADSGFIVNQNGFSFGNYGTNLAENGHCYGMATFAQFYYKKQLPLKLDSITSGEKKSYAYDLTNTYFKNYANLYDYKLKTNALKYAFGYDLFEETRPSDIKTVKNDKLTFTEIYKKDMIDSGIYDIIEQESTLSKEQQIKKYGVTYKTSDNLYMNEDKMQTSKIIDKNDLQMFNAIYAAFIKQNSSEVYSSGTNFVLWLRNVYGVETTNYKGGQGFINILVSRLNDKDVPVIGAFYSGGMHAINAISLVQDIENPNYYYIGVYDNNYPGEKRYVDIECKNGTCMTKANDYYSGKNQPIRITPSFEYDLNYYNSRLNN